MRRARLQADWGFSDLEMRDVVNAGAVELIEETVAAGAAPAAPASGGWASWPGAPTSAAWSWPRVGSRPAQVAEMQALVEAGDAQRQAGAAGDRGRRGRRRIVRRGGIRPRAGRGVRRGALAAAVDAAIAANPDMADKIRERQGGRRRSR